MHLYLHGHGSQPYFFNMGQNLQDENAATWRLDLTMYQPAETTSIISAVTKLVPYPTHVS